MCGLFGFVGKPDVAIVETIMFEASTRGPHAWGLASDVCNFKEIGNLREQAGRLAVALRGASWCIGNARMATFGAPDERNNQPITVGRATVVHNGNIYGANEIMHHLGHAPATQSDTEALAAALDRGMGFFDLPYRGIAQAAIWKLGGDGALRMASAGHPLYYAAVPEGNCIYICSRPAWSFEALPWTQVLPGCVYSLRIAPEAGVLYEVLIDPLPAPLGA